MATSGTYAWTPTVTDIVLDAFDRIQVRPAAITPDHLFSARRSLNQLFVRFNNRGINLWAVDEVTTVLNEGQGEYAVSASTVTMLETWIRSYQMNALESLTTDMSTTISDSEVVVEIDDSSGLQNGMYVTIPIYVAVGGLIISGTYPIVEIPSNTAVTIDAGSNATGTVNNGGAVPVYTTTASSPTVGVALAAHGLVAGDNYTVHELTVVGGLSLQGDYVVATAATNTLTFDAGSDAGSTDSASENDGEMQVATQNFNVSPQDRILAPISRTDWAALPNKLQEGGYPTSYWFNRTDPPTVNIWQVPDGTIVQELHYFRLRRIQDADPTGTQTADVPNRFEEALCAGLTYFLAIKWKPEVAADMKTYFQEVWDEAMSEDRERVTLNIAPNTQSYYQ